MASWQDGPEYAPQERPAAFVVPEAPPLAPAPAPQAPPVLPVAEPTFTPPSGAQPDLAALGPSAAPGRNPNLAFEVVTATLTNAGGAGGGPESAAHPATAQRSPQQPFRAPGPSLNGYLPVQPTVAPNSPVNPAPFPAPGTPQWFAPPPGTRVPDAPPPPVTVAQIWTATTAGVMVPLIIGMFFPWLSIMMLALSFALSARIAYRKDAIRRSYFAALIVVGVLGMTSMLSGYDSDLLFENLSGGAQLACVVLPLVIGLIVGAALRAGERPDRTG